MANITCTIEGFTEEANTLLNEIGTVALGAPDSDTEILLVQLGFNVDKDIIDASPNLKVIATATTGLDHIDTAYAESKNIQIISLKGETEFLNSITSTSELALGLMIALARNIPAASNKVLEGKWDREGHRGHTLNGKTLGVVGLGRLGKLMATYGEGLGMNVIFTDPDVEGGVSPEELLKTSDVVSIHVHLQEDTENMFCEPSIAMMKPGALLINTARGKIVDEAAALKALEAGTLGGYATDVLADELSFADGNAKSALIDYAKTHSNVIITPHIGGTTVESREATDVFIVRKLQKEIGG
ncbi:MAG: NAD(P)-dependent oxidoreductase [Candidatus Peribacteraceae bacterium]|nr:NAD(P)-dependent oxidoreductase [Candidatus Peribacteraceae bacterium]